MSRSQVKLFEASKCDVASEDVKFLACQSNEFFPIYDFTRTEYWILEGSSAVIDVVKSMNKRSGILNAGQVMIRDSGSERVEINFKFKGTSHSVWFQSSKQFLENVKYAQPKQIELCKLKHIFENSKGGKIGDVQPNVNMQEVDIAKVSGSEKKKPKSQYSLLSLDELRAIAKLSEIHSGNLNRFNYYYFFFLVVVLYILYVEFPSFQIQLQLNLA